MTMKIYAGNLAATTTDADLNTAFAAYGTVDSCKLALDRDSGQPKGFGFVEMGNDTEAQAAIDGLNGTQLGGNAIRVNVSVPKTQNRAAGGGY
jgi:RNA recognition motif-containing protein